MPLKTNRTQQPDRSKVSRISSLATSLGCQQGTEHTGKRAKLVTVGYLAGERRGQEPFQ